jgi:hypothetical protein
MFDRVVDRFRQGRLPGTDGDATVKGDSALAVGPPIVIQPGPSDPRVNDHRLSGFDLHSVVVFAARFFACVAAMVMAGTFVLWVFASLLGLVSAFEEFMQGIGFTDFRLLSIEFLFGLALLTAAFMTFMVGMTVVAAGLYNVLASRWGGVRIFVSDDVPNAVTAPSNGNGSGNGAAVRGNGVKRVTVRRAPAPRVRENGTRPKRRGPSAVA